MKTFHLNRGGFEGDGGYVSVAIDIGEEKTTGELETQGWDDHVKQFVQELAEFEERVIG